MTKLKQEYMFNHNGKNWVILDDFMALKEKLKKTQKEYAKARNQLNEANEVIKSTRQITGNIDLSQFDYEHRRKIDGITMQTGSYLEKWGVK